MKPTINVRPIIHKNSEQIGIYFKNDLSLNIIIRKNANGIWSQTKKCWYIPLDRNAFERLKAAVNDFAILETSELKKYLERKNRTIVSNQLITKKPAISKRSSHLISTISPVNKHVLPSMKETLILKGLSSSTIKTYINEMSQLLLAIKDIPADDLKPEHLKRYLAYCYERLGLKENTLHSRINPVGLKKYLFMYYYVYVLFSEIDRQFYTGYTSDLSNRLNEHKNGKVASTKYRRPLKVIYFEGCLNQQDATRREKYLKSGNGKIYLKSRLSNFFNPTG